MHATFSFEKKIYRTFNTIRFTILLSIYLKVFYYSFNIAL